MSDWQVVLLILAPAGFIGFMVYLGAGSASYVSSLLARQEATIQRLTAERDRAEAQLETMRSVASRQADELRGNDGG